MVFHSEIKQFIKNTLILMVVFALVIHFSWGYIVSFLGFSAKAYNDNYFQQANVPYIGNVATALSLNLGGARDYQSTDRQFSMQIVSIAEVMGDPETGQQKLIESNMQSIRVYAGILKQDITQILGASSSRSKALENHISLLKNYFTKGQEALALIQSQKQDLKQILDDTETRGQEAKNTLQTAYNTLKYNGVEDAINSYLQIKNINTRAKIYMIYLDRFEKSYTTLQNKNQILQNVLEQNKKPITEEIQVVIPSVWAEIVRELGLIEAESDRQAKELLK